MDTGFTPCLSVTFVNKSRSVGVNDSALEYYVALEYAAVPCVNNITTTICEVRVYEQVSCNPESQMPNITPFIELKQYYWLSFATKVTIGGQIHLCFSNQVWYVWFTTNWLQILFLLTLVLLLVSSCVTFQVKKKIK